MPMDEREQLVGQLRQLKPALAQRYKVRGLALFGSLARGAQSADSDVDLLVDFEDDADLLDMMGLANDLEEALARKVDVVPRRALRPEIRDQVLGEMVPL